MFRVVAAEQQGVAGDHIFGRRRGDAGKDVV
jgi:hypothetical protein